MRHLIDAVRSCVADRNWYSALATALSLPDIAGHLDTGTAGSQARYVLWFDTYLRPTYTRRLGPADARGRDHVFLTGQDCYALRCAYLHQGDFDITGQKAQNVLDVFAFTFSTERGPRGHMNQRDAKLQLDVGRFCEEVCVAAESWLRAKENDPDVSARLAALPQIVAFDGRI